MAERRDPGGGADVPDGEGVNFPVPAENFVDKRERVCYDVMRVQETAPSCGEMSEWLKEPVLKTGGAQVPVGSNPTLSANSFANLFPPPSELWTRGSTQVAEGAPLLRE